MDLFHQEFISKCENLNVKHSFILIRVNGDVILSPKCEKQPKNLNMLNQSEERTRVCVHAETQTQPLLC